MSRSTKTPPWRRGSSPGIAPLGDIDQLELLRSTSLPQLLTRLIDLTVEAGETLTATWGDEQPGDSGWGTGA